MAKWKGYRDSCLKPHNHDSLVIVLQLGDYCHKDLQTILRSNVMGNNSTEPDMLAKMKAVTVRTRNVLVNVNNFLCMTQERAKNIT